MGQGNTSDRMLWRLVAILFLVTTGLGLGAYSHFQRVRDNLRQESAADLTSVADLKVAQIDKWKRERSADGRFFFSSRAFFQLVKRVLGRDGGAVSETADWLLPLLESHDYRLILLLDADKIERFRVGVSEEDLGPDALAALDQARLAGRIRFSELYATPSGQPAIDMAVPLTDTGRQGAKPVGFLLFRIDPAQQLFPLLRSWPRGSTSGETLLARRDGDSVLFLSWLRHRRDAPLSLRVPLSQEDLPAAFGARGESGIVEGRDYRGVPVLAVVRHIPDSSWLLVSKVDLVEVYGGVGDRTRSFIFAMTAVLILVFVGIGLLFRQQQLQWSLRQARLQSERDAITRHLGEAAKHANDAILLADSSQRLIEVNDRAVTLYGWDREELLDRSLEDLRSPSLPKRDTEKELQIARDGLIYESVHRRKDGSEFPVEVSARRIQVNGGEFLQAIVRDVTQRKDDEKKIARLSRLESFRSQIGHAIIHAPDPETLFEETCRIAVGDRIFRLAWFGVKDERTGAITPVAKAGDDNGYVAKVLATTNDEARGRGPAGTAMREGRPVVVNDILADDAMRPWRNDCLERDYLSAAAFPILGTALRAIFVLYSPEPGFFDEEEVRSLESLTADLAFAIKFHQREKERREAELALMAGERKLRDLVETTHDLVWAMDSEGRITEISSDSVRMFGLRPDELLGRSFTELLHPDSREAGWRRFRDGVVTGEPTVSFEAKVAGANGRTTYLSVNAVFLYDQEDNFLGQYGTAQDITEKKEAEAALRESEERFQTAQAVAHVGTWELRADEGVAYLSDEACRLFGLPVSTEAIPISTLTPLVDNPGALNRRLIRVLKRGQKLAATVTVHPADGSAVRHLSAVAERKPFRSGKSTRIVGALRDITAQTLATETLKRTEEKLRALFESDAVGVLFGDIHGRILDANQKLLDMIGYSREELESGSVGWLQITPPEFLPLDQRRIEEARRLGSCTPYRKQYIRKDGSRVWVLVGFTLIGERREDSVAFVIDSTRLIEAEEASEAAELKYRLLVEQASDGIYSVDSSGRITFANSQFCKLFGYSAVEALGINLKDLVSGEELAHLKRLQSRAQDGEGVRFECRMRRKDGQLFAAEGSMRGVAGGGFQNIVRDVTQRRTDEERLRLLSGALQSAANGVVITDRTGVILWVNKAFTELTGYSSDEVVGANPKVLKSGQHDEAFYSTLWRTVLSGEIWQGEIVNRRKDGTLYQEEMTITPIRGTSGEVTHFIAIKQDCSERKRAQETLRRTNERLVETLKELKEAERQIIQQEQLRALGTMASGIAHDFNNSLLVILGFSELLLNQPETLQDREKAGRYLTFINTAAKDAGKVVARLREFYRKRDKGDVFGPVSPNELVEEAISLTQPRWESQAQIGGSAIELRRELGDVPTISGDQAELREALTNLIFNAVDAMPEGGTITFRTEEVQGRVVVSIIDNGVGMSEQVRTRCLEPFFTTKGEHGSGLGLSMVYGIVKRHDGEVAIETKLGKGTAIRISFPVERHETGEYGQPPEADFRRPSKVLLIDDESAVLQVLTRYLEIDGHSVEATVSGGDGLTKFKDGEFDLVILDRAMPGMNGDQVASQIKRLSPQTPIIMLTGFGSMMTDLGETPDSVDLVLGKPVTQRQVRSAIAQVVRA